MVEYRDIRDMSIFSLKLVVIEVESGLCTWEGKFGGAANYQVWLLCYSSVVMNGAICTLGVCRGFSHLLAAGVGTGGDRVWRRVGGGEDARPAEGVAGAAEDICPVSSEDGSSLSSFMCPVCLC